MYVLCVSCVCPSSTLVHQVFAKFDTSLEPLEPLSAELNVKALPVFKFYKVWAVVARLLYSCLVGLGRAGPACLPACLHKPYLAC